MMVTWTKPGHRALRRRHPAVEERWEILRGRAAFEIDGVLIAADPGSSVVAGPTGRASRGTPARRPWSFESRCGRR
jgi:mannose-6-phosphate isomerase-like protein (cupin superfamily)